MTASLIVVVQEVSAHATVQAPAAPAAPAHPALPSRSQLAEEIRQATQDALDGSRAATEAANATGRTVRIFQNGRSIDIAPIAPVPVPGVSGIPAPIGGGPRDVPPEAASVAYAFFLTCAVIAIGWPIARAFARRIDRRSEAPAALPPSVADQLVRIEQAVEAMSIEVERISESQRFVAKLQHGATVERV
jgi:hypothetical protein